MRSSTVQLPRHVPTRLSCAATLLALALACIAPTVAQGETPRPPTVGDGPENLSLGFYWGLYEQRSAESSHQIAIVGAPMPIEAQITDNHEDRLFMVIQHRAPADPYCAPSPAEIEDVSVDLTSPAGNPTKQGAPYRESYVWTPTEAGEFTACAYLDATPSGPPVSTNFVQLLADPSPGELSFAIASQAETPASDTVTTQGMAVVPSQLSVSEQQQGLPCTLPEGGLAGQTVLAAPVYPNDDPTSPEALSGPFSVTYPVPLQSPGAYELCAYLTPDSNAEMDFWRPYEVGSADFTVAPAPAPEPPTEGFVLGHRLRPLPPALSAVSISNRRFHVSSLATHGQGPTPAGTIFRFAVSAKATVTIAIARLLPGVLRAGACEPPRHRDAARRGCQRQVKVAVLMRHVAPGSDAIAFNGSILGEKPPSGGYVATLTAHDSGGSSAPVRVGFSVAP